jgi:DNA modification methylase
MNKLILGDNLEIMRKMDSESVDLIYLDPPFFSNRNYEVIWGDEGEIRSFKDRWSGGVDHYIAWLKERVIEMHRILKFTGSIFLHCDWHANAHIRILILDKIFGENCFQNEIIWYYTGAGTPKERFSRRHDTIFWYSKSMKKWTFNVDEVRTEYSDATLERFKHSIGNKRKGSDFGEQSLNPKGKHPDDVFQISIIAPSAKERIGYPTQKPEKLLERIIRCSTNESDLVFDPFVGGGTACVVAEKLKRNWIGIDQSVQAIKITELRLQKELSLFSQPFVVQLHKYDYDILRNKQAFEFETWIIEQYGGTANTKQRSDLGLDGKTVENTPIQVKRSDNIGRNVIDNFHSAVMRNDKALYEKNKSEDKSVGIIIAFSFGKGAIQEVARLKNQENVKIELVTVAEIVPIAKKPTLTVKFNDLGIDNKKLREIEFIATAEGESGIEFYAWDFNYNAEKGFSAEILLDKEGKQTYKFKAGSYSIAIKVIDNEGLENIEIINLKINGIIEIK